MAHVPRPPRGGQASAVLRLVPDIDPAPAPRRRGPSRALRLTDEEVRHLRASIRNLARVRFGTLAALAKALEVNPGVLTRRKRPGGALVVAIWRLTGVPLEVLFSGKLAAVPSPGASNGGAA